MAGNKNFKTKLGNRKDFWNTSFNPITGFYVPSGFYAKSQKTKHIELIAEYNYNNFR